VVLGLERHEAGIRDPACQHQTVLEWHAGVPSTVQHERWNRDARQQQSGCRWRMRCEIRSNLWSLHEQGANHGRETSSVFSPIIVIARRSDAVTFDPPDRGNSEIEWNASPELGLIPEILDGTGPRHCRWRA
jgi:hypothetical protein